MNIHLRKFSNKYARNVFVVYVLTEKADTLRPSDYPTLGS